VISSWLVGGVGLFVGSSFPRCIVSQSLIPVLNRLAFHQAMRVASCESCLHDTLNIFEGSPPWYCAGKINISGAPPPSCGLLVSLSLIAYLLSALVLELIPLRISLLLQPPVRYPEIFVQQCRRNSAAAHHWHIYFIYNTRLED
jgi:hypothetical protein